MGYADIPTCAGQRAAADHGCRQRGRQQAFCDLELRQAPEPAHNDLLHAERARMRPAVSSVSTGSGFDAREACERR
jgi:hypothetical protein